MCAQQVLGDACATGDPGQREEEGPGKQLQDTGTMSSPPAAAQTTASITALGVGHTWPSMGVAVGSVRLMRCGSSESPISLVAGLTYSTRACAQGASCAAGQALQHIPYQPQRHMSHGVWVEHS